MEENSGVENENKDQLMKKEELIDQTWSIYVNACSDFMLLLAKLRLLTNDSMIKKDAIKITKLNVLRDLSLALINTFNEGKNLIGIYHKERTELERNTQRNQGDAVLTEHEQKFVNALRLNVQEGPHTPDRYLTTKFAIMDKNLSFFETIFNPLVHQFIVANCSFQAKVALVESDEYSKLIDDQHKMGIWSPIWPLILLLGILALVSVLFNFSLILVTFTKITDHKVCNWLLAFDSLCQLFFVAPFLVNFLALILQYNTVDYPSGAPILMLSKNYREAYKKLLKLNAPSAAVGPLFAN
ncbi:hypothetical protein niasHS_004388 [Heterodera schachtii]|uniref:Uncharacterized protein n=1 Tax=Heterodera schachtii TaxID=97005 RepID=A0ABD2K199_HETSC